MLFNKQRCVYSIDSILPAPPITTNLEDQIWNLNSLSERRQPEQQGRERKGQGGDIQDKCFIPHGTERLIYDLSAMDLVFRDQVFYHSLHPLLVLLRGATVTAMLLAPGLDPQQAVWIAEPCKYMELKTEIPPSESPCVTKCNNKVRLSLRQ